jgi:chromate transporter
MTKATSNEPTASPSPSPGDGERTSLAALAWLFLRLGTTAFGGPAAHIAMMQDEVVRRRRWLTETAFLDLVAATNLIPGPNSTELAIHIGLLRRGWPGLVVAGVAFIVPAMLITGAMGALYVQSGEVPAIGHVLVGVKPVMVAVILQALVSLTPKAARSWPLRLTGLGAVVAAAVGAPELAVLLGAGLAGVFWMRPATAPATTAAPPLPVIVPWGPLGLLAGQATTTGVVAATTTTTAAAFSLPMLFWVFAKAGALLFGSGYVLLAFLKTDLVEGLGWLTSAQLMDAIAVGQVTPGPVFTTATFIGYLLGGVPGAVVATVGIFLPAFIFVALSGPLIPRLRRSPGASAFLDGVTVASLALMAVVLAELARVALVDVGSVLVGLVAAVLLLGTSMRSTWLIVAGALFGVVQHGLWG